MASLRSLLSHASAGAILTLTSLASGEAAPVFVDLSVGGTIADEAALSNAIGRELGCPIVTRREAIHSGEVTIRAISARQVSVTFIPANHGLPLKRVVALPQTPEHKIQLIAWLVGNLARNEAADWLANQKRDKEADSAREGAMNSVAALADAPNTEASQDELKDAAGQETNAKATESFSVGNAADKKNNPIVQNGPKAPAPSASKKPETASATGTRQSANALDSLRNRTLNLAVWHKVLELHRDSETSRFALHLGIGYGRVGAIRGFGFDLLHHRAVAEVQGVASSLGWTHSGRTQGLAWSAGLVTADGELTGVDYAGLVAVRHGNVSGVQLAGLVAMSDGDFLGVKGAGVFTTHQGKLRGLQMSAAANVAGQLFGVQLGAVNVAKDVRGIQFGLVNVARRVDGISIGLVNMSENVRTQALAWAERNYLENVGVRYVYAPLTFGISSGYDSANGRLRFLFGFGARFAYKQFALAPSVDAGFVLDDVKNSPAARGRENDLRVALEWEPVPKILGITAGPAIAFRSDANNHLQWVPRWFAGLTLF